MTSPEHAAGPPRLLQGRYRLLHPIATGGMAEVWEGVDEVLARPVAIKRLLPHLAQDEAFRERFRREAISAARLADPRVVATFDTGEDDTDVFIVMELVRGNTLRDELAKGPMPPATAATIAIQVADALAVAHASGIIHRDIKPGNILVCDPATPGVGNAPGIKVADFGIARAAFAGEFGDSDLTEPGALLGTVKYMSPEQAKGDEPDERSDIYSLGVVLYEMLTGRTPFAAQNDVATALAHVHQQPHRPRNVRAGIPRSLDDIVMKAIAKAPEDRFPSAGAMAAALRSADIGPDDALPLVDREPTPPGGAPAAFRESERRWLVPAVLIVLIAVTLVVLAIVLSRSDVGRRVINRSPTTPLTGQTLRIDAVHSFDPEGQDKTEHEEVAGLAADNNPSTSWHSNTYDSRNPPFGGLKQGVGLRVDLLQRQRLSRLVVSSPTSGWSAKVYVADAAQPTLAGWGHAVDSATGIQGSKTFNLHGVTGQSVLVWFTQIGDDNRVEVAEITVKG